MAISNVESSLPRYAPNTHRPLHWSRTFPFTILTDRIDWKSSVDDFYSSFHVISNKSDDFLQKESLYVQPLLWLRSTLLRRRYRTRVLLFPGSHICLCECFQRRDVFISPSNSPAHTSSFWRLVEVNIRGSSKRFCTRCEPAAVFCTRHAFPPQRCDLCSPPAVKQMTSAGFVDVGWRDGWDAVLEARKEECKMHAERIKLWFLSFVSEPDRDFNDSMYGPRFI